MSWLFAAAVQSIGVSASAPVLPMNIQGLVISIQNDLESEERDWTRNSF